jgi:hypothetical protein
MSTDPVFAAIEARNVTAAAAQAAKGDRELNSTSDAEHRSRVTTVPTTIYGVLALVQYVQECTRR